MAPAEPDMGMILTCLSPFFDLNAVTPLAEHMKTELVAPEALPFVAAFGLEDLQCHGVQTAAGYWVSYAVPAASELGVSLNWAVVRQSPDGSVEQVFSGTSPVASDVPFLVERGGETFAYYTDFDRVRRIPLPDVGRATVDPRRPDIARFAVPVSTVFVSRTLDFLVMSAVLPDQDRAQLRSVYFVEPRRMPRTLTPMPQDSEGFFRMRECVDPTDGVVMIGGTAYELNPALLPAPFDTSSRFQPLTSEICLWPAPDRGVYAAILDGTYQVFDIATAERVADTGIPEAQPFAFGGETQTYLLQQRAINWNA